MRTSLSQRFRGQPNFKAISRSSIGRYAPRNRLLAFFQFNVTGALRRLPGSTFFHANEPARLDALCLDRVLFLFQRCALPRSRPVSTQDAPFFDHVLFPRKRMRTSPNDLALTRPAHIRNDSLPGSIWEVALNTHTELRIFPRLLRSAVQNAPLKPRFSAT